MPEYKSPLGVIFATGELAKFLKKSPDYEEIVPEPEPEEKASAPTKESK